jgi:hypothetical protein
MITSMLIMTSMILTSTLPFVFDWLTAFVLPAHWILD